MHDKTAGLLSLRPSVSTKPASGEAEIFQNLTLRPILKLQNDLLVRVFKQYIVQRKNVYYKLGAPDQQLYITQSLKQDQKFQQFLRGLIIGHFTDQEYETFLSNEQEINRRLFTLLEQRLLSNAGNF
jgi:hypothetical protein